MISATLFSSKGCGHCENFKREWKKFADRNSWNTNEVDCSEDLVKCDEMKIRRVPTVLFTHSNIPEFKLKHVGERTAEALHKTWDVLKRAF
jgi:hypothetical protein